MTSHAVAPPRVLTRAGPDATTVGSPVIRPPFPVDRPPLIVYTIITMIIGWDESKRVANLAKHDGLDFAALTPVFFESATIIPTKLGRSLAVGRFEGSLVTAVFAPLGREAISVISMRPASRKERAAYAP
jgi:uncharacterized DUF497 family protein